MPAKHKPDQSESESSAKDVEALLDEALEHIAGGVGKLPAEDGKSKKRRFQDDAADKPIKFI